MHPLLILHYKVIELYWKSPERTKLLIAGCAVLDVWPIIPTTALSTAGAGGIEPICDIA